MDIKNIKNEVRLEHHYLLFVILLMLAMIGIGIWILVDNYILGLMPILIGLYGICGVIVFWRRSNKEIKLYTKGQ